MKNNNKPKPPVNNSLPPPSPYLFSSKKDKIVEQVINQFSKRSEVGIKKYGTTLEENNNDDFLQHLKEELMDAVLYIEKLQSIKTSITNKIKQNDI